MSVKAVNSRSSSFPKSWKVVSFEEAFSDATGGNIKIKQSAYQKIGAIPVIDQGQEYVAGYIDNSKLCCKVKLPVVLFGDHTKIFKFVTEPFALGADGVKVLLPSSEVDAKFGYYFLRGLKLPDNTGYSRHYKYLKEAFIPLPSLPEQRRIAAILDKADAIRRKRQESIRLTEEFLRSVFLDMFGDPAMNPKGWDKVSIKKLGMVMTGNTPARERPEYYGDDIEWIKSDNINTPYHFLTEAKEKLSFEGKKVGRVVPENSILVTCIAGSPECIGNAALTDRPVAFNQQINAVTPFEGVDPFFLYVQLLTAKKLIQEQSTESMKGMVNKGKFENILLLKPPYPLQEKYGELFIKCHEAFCKNIRALTESDNLYDSIIQKAFIGEL